MSPFRITLHREPGGVPPVLRVEGELDLYTAREFEVQLRELAGAEPHGLVVDLTASTFVDSTACRALLHAARVQRQRGGRVVVVSSDPEVERILTVMGLDEFLDVVACPADARALASAAAA